MSNHKHGETPNGTGGVAKETATPDSNRKVGEAPTVVEGAPNAPAGEAPRRDARHEDTAKSE